jgi:hypothetical protein
MATLRDLSRIEELLAALRGALPAEPSWSVSFDSHWRSEPFDSPERVGPHFDGRASKRLVTPVEALGGDARSLVDRIWRELGVRVARGFVEGFPSGGFRVPSRESRCIWVPLSRSERDGVTYAGETRFERITDSERRAVLLDDARWTWVAPVLDAPRLVLVGEREAP